MADPSISKKRKRGNPNQMTGLIGVYKSGKKYRSLLKYDGKTRSVGLFDTKEQAGIAYDRFVVDKSTEEVSFTLNYPNDIPTKIKQDPEAEVILHKAKEVQVKSEPEADF